MLSVSTVLLLNSCWDTTDKKWQEIHNIMNSDIWKYITLSDSKGNEIPLTSSIKTTVKKGLNIDFKDDLTYNLSSPDINQAIFDNLFTEIDWKTKVNLGLLDTWKEYTFYVFFYENIENWTLKGVIDSKELKRLKFTIIVNKEKQPVEENTQSVEVIVEEVPTVTTPDTNTTVPDTEKPTLSSTSQTFTSIVWTAITLENVTAIDNVDTTVNVIISWDTVDSTTAWTYEVVYTATDLSWNISTITHTYIVEANTIPNTAPTALDETVDAEWNDIVIFDMNTIIWDVETEDKDLTIEVISWPTHWVLTWTGHSFEYEVTDWSWYGWDDSFTYKVKDFWNKESEVKTITITNISDS